MPKSRKLKKKWRKQQRTKLSISKLSIELTGLVGRLRVEEKELSFHPQGSIHLKAPLRGVSMEELQSAPHPTNVLNQSGGSSSSSRNSQGIRLPKISPQKFRGDMRNFQPFWQNLSLTDFHKLTYLVKSLERPAFKALGRLEITGENYGNAVQILKSRFGKSQHIISAHMQELLIPQSHPNESIVHLPSILITLRCM